MMTPAKSEELLALSAAQARRLAPQLCRRDPVSGQDCSWYHGLWQDLRLIGLAASLDQQSDFLRHAFGRLSRRPLRLLISGSADYSILAHVLSASSEHQLTPDITVVDVCETPLFFNRWYAEQAGYKIETIQADIFNHHFETQFDIIVSHGFLSQFQPAQRAGILRRWADLLTPDGTVLSINRVRSGLSGGETKFSEKQGREFCETVAEKLGQMPSLEESDRAVIRARAGIYVQRLNGYALTEEELDSLFHHAGLQIDECKIISSGAQDAKFNGPAIPANARHACVIASRM